MLFRSERERERDTHTHTHRDNAKNSHIYLVKQRDSGELRPERERDCVRVCCVMY